MKEDNALVVEAARIGEQLKRLNERLAAAGTLEATAELGASTDNYPLGPSGGERAKRSVRPPLPDPRLVRRIIRNRQLRGKYFDMNLFPDPAWDMLLDLSAARAEHRRVSVTSLCIASGVPSTTALRWIGEMVKLELFVRIEDQTDRRRAFIELSDRCADAIAAYFFETGSEPRR